MNSLLKNIQFVLCPGRNPEKKHTALYDKVYKAWHGVWSKAYAEIDEKGPLYSDTFTRHDFAAAIFYKNECCAFILFRHADLQREASLNDSYFEQWTKEHIQKVHGYGDQILICGNLGIVPTARGEDLGFPLKSIMFGFITEVCLHSSCDIVISTPRRDKNVNGTVYKWGGTMLAENISWGHGVQVDLTGFLKAEVLKKRNHDVMPIVNELWAQRLVIKEIPTENVNSFVNNTRPINTFKKAV